MDPIIASDVVNRESARENNKYHRRQALKDDIVNNDDDNNDNNYDNENFLDIPCDSDASDEESEDG